MWLGATSTAEGRPAHCTVSRLPLRVPRPHRWPGCEEGRAGLSRGGVHVTQSPYVTQKVPRSSSRLTERLVSEAASRANL